MDRQRIFMTGVTSGLGKVAALKLAKEGHHIIASCRNMKKGEELGQELLSSGSNPEGTIELVHCDLSSFASIRKACSDILNRYDALDQVILNAGVWHFERTETEDGIEEIFQVNLLAPALMIQLLSPLLSNPETSKIIITSSGLHQGTIQFDDIEFTKGFSGFKAYRQSKLGVILLTRLLHDQFKQQKVGVYCQHPGVVQTELGRHAGWWSRVIFKLIGKSPEKGARTLLYLAQTPKSDLTSGEYYASSKVVKATQESYNMETAKRLMEVIEERIG